MRRRSLRFQQQCFAGDGMWMEAQAQQQQSYAFYEESWSSDNNNKYHKQQFPSMHMKLKPGAFAMESGLSMSKHHGKLRGSYDMFQESMPGSGHGFGNIYVHGNGRKFPFGGTTTNVLLQFSNGSVRLNHGGHHDYISEEAYEYEAYNEEYLGAVTVTTKVDEMRYEHHSWGGDDCYVNPYNGYKNRKRHGGHRAEWTVKGV